MTLDTPAGDKPGVLAMVGMTDKQSALVIERYLLDRAPGDRVVYIPSAAVEWGQAAIDNLVTDVTQLFSETVPAHLDIPMIFSREEAHDPANVELVRRADFIYLGGGLPMRLAEILRDTPTWWAVLERWYAGAVLAGISAGAVVMTDEVFDSATGHFTRSQGLGLLPGLRVAPHLDTEKGQWILGNHLEAATPDLLVLGIPEFSAVVREPDGRWHCLGKPGVTLTRDGRDAGFEEIRGVQPRALAELRS